MRMNDDSWFSPMDILRLSVGTWMSLGLHAGLGVVALLMTIRLPSCAPPVVLVEAEPPMERLETIDLDLKPVAELPMSAGELEASARAKGEEGKMGGEKDGGRRYAIKSEVKATSISADLAKMDLAILGALKGSERSSVSDVFKSGSLGSDDLSARGNMWGDSIGESSGKGGLGLAGVGRGGGGTGEGTIGLGSIGTRGRGAGGTGQGYGGGVGRLGRGAIHRGGGAGDLAVGGGKGGSVKDAPGARIQGSKKGASADVEGGVPGGVEGGVAGGVVGGVPGGVVGGVPGGVVGGVPGGVQGGVVGGVVRGEAGGGQIRPGGGGLAGVGDAVKEKEEPSGDVRVGGVQVTGSLASSNVRSALAVRTSRLRKCYENALASNKSLAGRVEASLEIDADGRVSSVTEVPRSKTGDEGTTLGDPAAVRCVLATLRGMSKLKPVEGSATAVVKINFSPR